MAPEEIIAGGSCGESDCPTITIAGDGMVDVRGYHQPEAASVRGETVARVPAALIIEAARALARGGVPDW